MPISIWLPTTEAKRLVWAIRFAIILGLLVLIASAVDKGLWDWLKLLIIPAVIAGGTIWFNQRQQVRQQVQQDTLAKIEEEQAKHNEMVNALRGEPESVAYVAVQVREQGLPDDNKEDNKERRAQLLMALYLAMLFQHRDRTRSLVFSALRDSCHREYRPEVMAALRRLLDDFTRYKVDIDAAQRELGAAKFDFDISSMDKHLHRLKVLERALVDQKETGSVSE